MEQLGTATIIELIAQFLQDHGLIRTLRVLADETELSLGSVISAPLRDAICQDILEGQWESLLSYQAPLGSALLTDIYEQIFFETLEKGANEQAKRLLRQVPFLANLAKSSNTDRFLAMETALTRGSTGKSANRARIARRVEQTVRVIPQGRLAQLLTQALEAESVASDAKSSSLGLVSSAAHRLDALPLQTFITKDLSKAHCMTFSDDGMLLAAGLSSPDLVAVLHWQSSTFIPIAKQPEIPECRITALAFSPDSRMLFAGTSTGLFLIAAMQEDDGSFAFRSFAAKPAQLHHGSICSIAIVAKTVEEFVVLTSGSDGVVRQASIKTGKQVKEFRKHSVGITLIIPFGSTGFLSAGSDGIVHQWDLQSGRIVKSSAALGFPIRSIVFKNGILSVAGLSASLLQLPTDTLRDPKVLYKLPSEESSVSSMASSPDGRHLAALHSNELCFIAHSNHISGTIKDISAFAYHPLLNIIAFSREDEDAICLSHP